MSSSLRQYSLNQSRDETEFECGFNWDGKRLGHWQPVIVVIGIQERRSIYSITQREDAETHERGTGDNGNEQVRIYYGRGQQPAPQGSTSHAPDARRALYNFWASSQCLTLQ